MSMAEALCCSYEVSYFCGKCTKVDNRSAFTAKCSEYNKWLTFDESFKQWKRLGGVCKGRHMGECSPSNRKSKSSNKK